MMRDWKKILVSPGTPILTAIKLIDDSSLQIALVVDGNNRLLGTITDGDVRRGVLRGIPLDSPVQQIMNAHPITADLNDGRESIIALMKMKELRHIPLLDLNGCIAGIEILEDLIQLGAKDNWVILMAGGMGSRLHPLTKECPKPLLHVGNKPILQTILENFIEYRFHRFFLSVNYKAEMVKDYFADGRRWGVEIRYIHEDRALGTAGSLGLLPGRPDLPLIVMNGDLLTKVNFHQLLDFHAEHQAMGTMCIREYDFQVPYGVVKTERHRFLEIEEKPVQRFFVSAGIYVLEPMALDYIPGGSPFDMPDLFKALVARGHETAAFPIREYWLDIGRMDDLERAQGDFPEIFNS